MNCISPLRWSIGILAPCLLSHPLFAEDFFLDFDGPRLLTGARGSKVRGSFTCLLGNYQSGVAEGWAFGVVVDGGKIVSITLEGTAAEHARSFGFERTELTSGPGNEGAISKVVYSLTEPTSLGLYPPQVIAFLEVESDVSPGIHYATLRYHDGLRGSVELVENFVRSAGGRYVPTLTDRSIVISDEPPCGDLLLGFSGDNVDSPLPFEGVIGGVGTSGEVVFPTPQGEKGRVHLYADIVPLLPAGNDCSGGRIVEGWVLSVELTGEAEPAAVSVRGTSVDMYFWNGFERTLIAEAADNGGRKGFVSSVLLAFQCFGALPAAGTFSVLDMTIEGNVSQGMDDLSAQLFYSDGLRENQSPQFMNQVSLRGRAETPCNLSTAHATLRFRPGTPEFVRGNAMNDEKLDIADPVRILQFLFGSASSPVCPDAADANDDGSVDISDAVYILRHLFFGGLPPPPPFPECGTDPSTDTLQACASTCS